MTAGLDSPEQVSERFGERRSRGLTCVVADDHPVVLEAVCALLESRGVTVLARARDGESALALIAEQQPPVALVDLRLPGMSGSEAAREAQRLSPDTAVIVYTGQSDVACMTEVLDAGAKGFVLKDAPLEDLMRAIDMVAAGGDTSTRPSPASSSTPRAPAGSPRASARCSASPPTVSRARRSASGCSCPLRPSAATSATPWASSRRTPARRLWRPLCASGSSPRETMMAASIPSLGGAPQVGRGGHGTDGSRRARRHGARRLLPPRRGRCPRTRLAALPTNEPRNVTAISVTAIVALALSLVPLIGFDRLPVVAFELLASAGTLLVSSALWFGGTDGDEPLLLLGRALRGVLPAPAEGREPGRVHGLVHGLVELAGRGRA